MSDLSRVEQLLRNALGEDIYEVTPQSRVEELLAQLNELIEGISASVDPEELTPIVTAWLAENIHDGAVVDTSLSVAGAAAESKKTGDEINQLKEELSDIDTAIGGIDWKNDIDPNKCTADTRIKPNDGTLFTGATGWSATDYILLKANTTYNFDKLYYEWFAFYSTADKSFLSEHDVTVTHITGDNYKGTIVVGETDVYVRGSAQTNTVGVSAFLSSVYNSYQTHSVITIEEKYIDPINDAVTGMESSVGNPVYVNLIDASKITDDYLINATTGNMGADANWCCTDYILLKANTVYTFDKIYTQGFFAFYSTADKSKLSSPDVVLSRNNVNDNYYGSIEVGSSDLYFRGSILKANKSTAFLSSVYGVYKPYGIISIADYAKHDQCRFKKILIIGDSISAYNYQSYNKWVQALTEEGYFMANVNNNSVHATGYIATLSGNHDDTFPVRLKAVTNPSTYDLVIVFGGVNDFIQNVPMGTAADDDTEYFVPAVDDFYSYLTENFINARILVFLPLKCYAAYNSSGEPTVNTAGVKLTDYAEYIENVAKLYALPVFNLLDDSGFYPWVSDFKTSWTHSADGLHPTKDYSTKFLAPLIKNFIEKF